MVHAFRRDLEQALVVEVVAAVEQGDAAVPDSNQVLGCYEGEAVVLLVPTLLGLGFAAPSADRSFAAPLPVADVPLVGVPAALARGLLEVSFPRVCSGCRQ